MRKFLAILKDSLREAIDAKVFYVMVALSLLLTLVAFSLSFEPGPAREFMASYGAVGLQFEQSSVPDGIEDDDIRFLVMLENARKSGRSYNVEVVEPLPGNKQDDPASKYRVVLRINYTKEEEFASVRNNVAGFEERVKQQFGQLVLEVRAVEATSAKVIEIGDGKIDDSNKVNNRFVRIEVETAPTASTRRLWVHEASILFGLLPLKSLEIPALPLGLMLYIIEDIIVNGVGAWVTVLVGIVLTAFYIPNMLRKGTVDMLLVKPIHRSTLLIYKYVGGLTFIFLNTTIAVTGVWLAMSLRSGIWAPGFLLSIPIITFFFAILYSVSTLFGVLTKSPIAAILLTCLVWAVLFGVGRIKEIQDADKRSAEFQARVEKKTFEYEASGFERTIRAIHFVLPRTQDLDTLTTQLLLRELLTANQLKMEEGKKGAIINQDITWGESLTVSLVFVALMLGIACWRFSTMDY